MTSGRVPGPTPLLAAVPPSTPFVGPETLARRVGRERLLRLGANESAFGPAPRAAAAMRDAIAEVSWYGDPESHDLREALAAKHGCAPDEILVGSGIDDLLGLIVRAYVPPGEACVATRGTYPTLAFHITGFGARLETADPRGDGSLDVEALTALAAQVRPRVVYVANPDNPSGSFVEPDAIARVHEGTPDGALFVLDEAYADFVEPARLLAPGIHPNLIRLRTFSKAFGMAGARIGYALAHREVIATFQKIRLHFGVNRPAQAGALVSLGETAYVAEIVAEVARGRDEYHALGARLGVRTLPSMTNFVCFEIGTRADAEAMVGRLLELGVFVRKPWAPPIDGFIRVTVGNAAERAAFGEAFAVALAAAREAAPA